MINSCCVILFDFNCLKIKPLRRFGTFARVKLTMIYGRDFKDECK